MELGFIVLKQERQVHLATGGQPADTGARKRACLLKSHSAAGAH